MSSGIGIAFRQIFLITGSLLGRLIIARLKVFLQIRTHPLIFAGNGFPGCPGAVDKTGFPAALVPATKRAFRLPSCRSRLFPKTVTIIKFDYAGQKSDIQG
jgi:hypothetical protein